MKNRLSLLVGPIACLALTLATATLVSGCIADDGGTEPDPTPTDEPTPSPEPTPTPAPSCPTLPLSRPLDGQPLSAVSFSFDNYYPIAISGDGKRIAMHTRHSDAAASGRLAARVWNGDAWSTWDIAGTGSTGGIGGVPGFRLFMTGDQLHAIAPITVSGSAAYRMFTENTTHDGFGAAQVISNLESFYPYDAGSLDSEGYAAVVGVGKVTGSSYSSAMVIVERNSTGGWSASNAILSGEAAAAVPDAVGYHPDGTPWIVYSVTVSGTRTFKLTRRVGSTWQAGVVLGTATATDSTRLDASVMAGTGGDKVAFYWTDAVGGTSVTRSRTYDTSTRLLGESRAVLSVASASCGNCVAGSVAFDALGKTGVATARYNTMGTAWISAISDSGVSATTEYLPDYSVIGTIRPYYDSCGKRRVTFLGRPSRDAGLAMDFYVLPLTDED